MTPMYRDIDHDVIRYSQWLVQAVDMLALA